ncbi:hypothetical protein O1R50_18530 [Glycomyces luteolus]|uniref:Uncharacterized protein n=1 Tax=Glycomyces luteolus TaxID=2670330 RepID=A0A9X3SRP4_9ACTN|nr:hypothetical protein [Glycomyces luteolus]MDA1361631.1 hypothetical protein [Glycomyces luteolus]
MRIGITGHMNLSPETVNLVRAAIREALEEFQDGDLVGFSCLAAGADSIFAQAVLGAGGKLTVVVSSADYRDKKVDPEDRPAYDRLITQAAEVNAMPFETGGREAYAAANEHILASIDHLFAVWDGQLPAAKGGTADAVSQAQSRGIPVTVIWPNGSARV